MSSLPTLALKSSNKIIPSYLGNLSNTRLSSRRSRPSCHQFYPLLVHEHSYQWYHTSDLLV
jgi:hypothetical protein